MKSKKKITVAVLMGGRSAEHEISLQSAKNVIAAMDKKKYNVVPIGIDRSGQWYAINSKKLFLDENNPKKISLSTHRTEIIIKTDHDITRTCSVTPYRKMSKIDVVFPVLHGTYGEDGTMQGFLETLNVPYVGPDVLGSAIGMDKDIAKRLLRDAAIPISDFIAFKRHEKLPTFTEIKRKFGVPFFVKPANAGSSVGISNVHNQKEYKMALKNAFRFDTKILIEEFIKGREIECAVLGNEYPKASLPGEIMLRKHEFYSYKAKYLDRKGAVLKIPAPLPKNIVTKIQKIAINAFQTLSCEGMARVDFFLAKDDTVYVGEINTIPGFTKISMYPKLWEVSGLSYPKLIDRLISLAIERFRRKQKIKLSY